MDVREAIAVRKSIRAYQGTAVEKEKLEMILEAARLAPTASNTQAHKVVVVKDQAMRQKLVAACRNQKMVGEAPVVLVVCADNQRDMPCKQPARVVDCSIALSFMMLQATELGLSTCWLGAFSEEEVRSLLHIPEEYTIVAVSPLGYAAEEGRERSRKPLEDFIVPETF